MNITEALTLGAAQLIASDSSRLDAELLLCRCLQKPRSFLYTWPDATLDKTIERQFFALLERRASGEPVAYILRQRMFWSLDLLVDSTTLIPRPETERLVEVALSLDLPVQAQVLDLGTGSGAIALALATERPAWRITASDIAASAVALARQNQRRTGVTNVHFLVSDWFAAVGAERFDLIVSNPPYVAELDPHLLQGDLRFEPRTALTAGVDGLDAIRRIVSDAQNYLVNNGWLLVEHGCDQAAALRKLFRQHRFSAVEVLDDLAGRPRLTIGQAGGR